MVEMVNLNILWIILCSILVFIMQAGFMCLEAGMTREKNNINVAIKNICDFGISAMVYWLFGFAIMFGASKFGAFGTSYFFGGQFLQDKPIMFSVFFIFQLMFCGASVSIISGAVAERMTFEGYLIIAFITAGFLYPIIGHWAWNGINYGEVNGWLGQLGFVDFAGSTIVHSVGGWIALSGVLILGPRTGRFPENATPRRFNANNLPLSVLGTLLLWFGWFGFNGGSTLSLNGAVPDILQNTLMAGAAGIVAAIVLGLLITKKVNVFSVINGGLGGLVSITAGCNAVTLSESVLIGIVGSGVVMLVDHLLEINKIDDVVGAIPVHLGAGIWGTIAVGLFGDPQILATGLSMDQQLIIQIIGISAIGVFIFSFSYVFLRVVNQFIPLRVSLISEEVGLNIAEHDANTDLQDLLKIMSEQANSSDISQRADQNPFTQTGMIGMHYNNLLFNLEKSIEKTDELLTNVIPKTIADRLKSGEQIADSYNEVSIMFADLVGFTELTQKLVARRVVGALNDIFSTFDKIAEKYGVEKVKTIGDGYMAVSGLFKYNENHAIMIANMACEMHKAIEKYNKENKRSLKLRIGINSGPIIAGVIGDSRFLYDMWGDTVNTASRMESTGTPGETQVTEKTYDLLKDEYRFEKLPPIDVKGKGIMQTFKLLN